MHFWIDKRSQGCGYRGRHPVPPSLSGYGRNQRLLSGGLHPKPMVTPVHRFQSIVSVANNGLRHARAPGCHPRVPATFQPAAPSYNNGSVNSVRSPQAVRTVDMIIGGQLLQSPTPTPRRNSTPTAKLKCGVWVFFAIVTFFLAGAKYYFHGVNIGMEAFAFCSLLVIILIIGGLVSLYEAITASAPQSDGLPSPTGLGDEETPHNLLHPPGHHPHHHNSSNQVPIPSPMHRGGGGGAEMPPPPYHIAIMLPSSQNDSTTTTEIVQVIRDSPPPSYDKAVT